MRQRAITALASLLLALGGLAVTAGPASAESYGYITWTNNCGKPWLYSIIHAGGSKAGTLVVQESDVAVGGKRSQRVQSGYTYNVTRSGGWGKVTIYNISGKVHSAAVTAC
ncbi:hypothetical protein FHX81_5597 [Saccharothrix saharensis]|uniref:Peptidase inhibitor family I36 n=1 Tax=Saccharothrix saharensis TaxID=571190 RepID=A0A543JJZ5_9PSEU|nr:hypothetical protein [Saccharothrix saharensis]TQM83179.1 hypothetical protein FHX81_5597 [Saccharothrix saharensis]